MGSAKILILTGPTASGKSAIALDLAQKKGGVIINADSQQLYRDLPILTARPTAREEAKAPHKLYGMLASDVHCSAGQWLKLACMEIDWALSQGALPMVTGGTGLYLKALLEGLAEMPDIDPAVRAQAVSDYEAMGKDAFARRLHAVDPAFFERLKVQDKQRLVRAYEVWLGSGKPLSWWQAQKAAPAYPKEWFTVLQADMPRDELYARCDARFLHMMEQGALQEVKAMWRDGDVENKSNESLYPHISISPHPLLKIIGVSQLCAHLRGELTLDQAVADAQQATRNYAKRQLTWFRHQLKDARLVSHAAGIPDIYAG